MREIKFRAWEKHEKRIMPHEGIKKFSEEVRKDLFGGIEKKFELLVLINSDDVELMQYTGLIDEDGIEIYEGDIVTCDRNINDTFDKTTFEVKFEPTEGFYGESKLGNTVYGEDFNSAKVVGNIYENPELLTKQV